MGGGIVSPKLGDKLEVKKRNEKEVKVLTRAELLKMGKKSD